MMPINKISSLCFRTIAILTLITGSRSFAINIKNNTTETFELYIVVGAASSNKPFATLPGGASLNTKTEADAAAADIQFNQKAGITYQICGASTLPAEKATFDLRKKICATVSGTPTLIIADEGGDLYKVYSVTQQKRAQQAGVPAQPAQVLLCTFAKSKENQAAPAPVLPPAPAIIPAATPAPTRPAASVAPAITPASQQGSATPNVPTQPSQQRNN